MPDDSPFWTFSLAVYETGGTAPACLALQESHGLDVNVLLFCCWAGVQGHTLHMAQIEQCLDAVRDWHGDIVEGLRAVRARLKGGHGGVEADRADPLRKRVLELELEAEKIEQDILAAAVPVAPVRDADSEQAMIVAAGNVARYFAVADFTANEQDFEHVSTVIGACFPEADGEEIADAVARAFDQ